ncbi:MAG: DUF2784 domain-containing protein [Gemmataceae bacterium]
MDWRALLADVVVAIHVGYVAFVVFGQLGILVGLWRGWRWVRNLWFRLAHLLAILIVAGESLLDIPCPLTVWEHQLRVAAGQSSSGESFVGRLLHSLIFVTAPAWAFTATYIAFAMTVLATFAMAPPRRRGSQGP